MNLARLKELYSQGHRNLSELHNTGILSSSKYSLRAKRLDKYFYKEINNEDYKKKDKRLGY